MLDAALPPGLPVAEPNDDPRLALEEDPLEADFEGFEEDRFGPEDQRAGDRLS